MIHPFFRTYLGLFRDCLIYTKAPSVSNVMSNYILRRHAYNDLIISAPTIRIQPNGGSSMPTRKTSKKTRSAKKSATRKTAARKSGARKSAAKASRRTASKKTSKKSTKRAAKKSAKKATARKAPAKKASAKKRAAKSGTARRAARKRPSVPRSVESTPAASPVVVEAGPEPEGPAETPEMPADSEREEGSV